MDNLDPSLGLDPGEPHRSPVFAATRWTLVLNARDGASPTADAALATLCRVYWYPLYAFARRQGVSHEEAEDLTQGFFARLLDKAYLNSVAPEKGKFRTFLMTALKNYINEEWKRADAQKRGGGITHEPLEIDDGEQRYSHEPIDIQDPEKLYTRRWALTLLEQARVRHQQEYEDSGKSAHYVELRRFEIGESDSPLYSEVAARSGLTEGGLKAAVHRFRKRYLELVREEVANTVGSAEEVDRELRQLIEAVAN